MKFIITRASGWGGSKEIIDLPRVSWEKVPVEDRRYITEEKAKTWSGFEEFKQSNPGGYRIEEGTEYIIDLGRSKILEVIEISTIEELMSVMKQAGYSLILKHNNYYGYPVITIYDDYME